MSDTVVGDPRAGMAFTEGADRLSRSYQGVGQGFGSLRSSTDKLGQNMQDSSRDFRGIGIGMRRITNEMEILGIITDEQYAVLRSITSAVLLFTYTASAYRSVIAIVDLLEAKVAALAAAETTAHIVAQDYASVALAAAVSSAVMVGIAGGVFVGREISRDIDIESSAGQNEIGRTIQEADYGS